MTKSIHGTIRGRTIELTEDTGLAEGQEVEVKLKAISRSDPWGEGLRRCAGALAKEWTEDDDRILEQIYADRKNESRREAFE
jgi:hypothetical protein